MTLQDRTNLIAIATAIKILSHYGFSVLGSALHEKLTDEEKKIIVQSDLEPIIKQSEYLANGNRHPNYHDCELTPSIFSHFSSQTESYYVIASALNAKEAYVSDKQIDTTALMKDAHLALKELQRDNSLSIFVDDIDTFFQTFLHAFHADNATSLYDYLHQSMCFACALWRRNQENPLSDNRSDSMLFIQGDFFGIQRFIFASNIEHNKKMAQILRGKSAGVSLLMELCILRIVEKLELSPASVSRSAAGKFTLIASSDTLTLQRLKELKIEIDQWFLEHFYGEFGIGLSWLDAHTDDFSTDVSAPKNIKYFMRKLSKRSEYAKSTKFNLPTLKNPVVSDYICSITKSGKVCPACDRRAVSFGEFCSVCGSFRELGAKLVNHDQKTLWIYYKNDHIFSPLGFSIHYSEQIGKQSLRRWDIRLSDKDGTIYHAMARRTLKAYIPKTQTFEDLAKNGTGTEGLIAIKADIDNLGALFAERIHTKTIASLATSNSLSRIINHFFTHKIAFMLAHTKPQFQNIYTVFAGGDDLFLIGTWDHTLEFVNYLKEEFDRYFLSSVTNMSFSAGLAMFKSGVPITHIAHVSENHLDTAKAVEGKNSVSIFGECTRFDTYKTLLDISREIDYHTKVLKLPTSYLRHIITFGEDAKKSEIDIFATKWNAQFRYVSVRNVIDKAKQEDKDKAIDFVNKLGSTIQTYKGGMKIVMFPILYAMRGGTK